MKKNHPSLDITVFVSVSKKGWGAVGINQRYKSIIFQAGSVFAENSHLSPYDEQTNNNHHDHHGNQYINNYNQLKLDLGVIGALKKLLSPTPGLPSSSRLNVTVFHHEDTFSSSNNNNHHHYHDDDSTPNNINYNNQISNYRSEGNNTHHQNNGSSYKSNQHKHNHHHHARPTLMLLSTIITHFHHVEFFNASEFLINHEHSDDDDDDDDDDTNNPASSRSISSFSQSTKHLFSMDAHEHSKQIASTISIDEKNTIPYYPNLCMTAFVSVRDVSHHDHHHHHHHTIGHHVRIHNRIRRNSHKSIEINITHDLMNPPGKKSGISIIDWKLASTLHPNLDFHLRDCNDLTLVTTMGQMQLNVLGIYPGTLEVKLLGNENVTIHQSSSSSSSGNNNHNSSSLSRKNKTPQEIVQRIDGALVVLDFPSPLFLSIDPTSSWTVTPYVEIDQSIDTFEPERFDAPYCKHTWWKNAI